MQSWESSPEGLAGSPKRPPTAPNHRGHRPPPSAYHWRRVMLLIFPIKVADASLLRLRPRLARNVIDEHISIWPSRPLGLFFSSPSSPRTLSSLPPQVHILVSDVLFSSAFDRTQPLVPTRRSKMPTPKKTFPSIQLQSYLNEPQGDGPMRAFMTQVDLASTNGAAMREYVLAWEKNWKLTESQR
jgi:hypothetical protein